jgi:two-component system sensor histidine kinase UhpB
MTGTPEPHLAEAFADDIRRAMARRVLLGVCFLAGMTAVPGIAEFLSYPERLGALLTSFGIEMALCGVVLLASRWRPLQRWILPLVMTMTLGVVVCVVAYVVWVVGSADALAMLLVIYMTSAALIYPWGLRGQVPIVIGTCALYAFALSAGLPRGLPLHYDLFCMAGGATTSLIGAVFLFRSRRAIFQQRLLLAHTRDRQMAMLYDVTRTVTSTLDVEQVLRSVCESVLEALRVDRLWLFWREQPDAALSGLEALRRGGEVSLRAMEGDPQAWEPLLISALDTGPERMEANSHQLSLLGADVPLEARLLHLPLRFRSELVGTIIADCGVGEAELEASFLDLAATLGNSAAMAIANARLHALVLQHRAALQRLGNKRLDLVEEGMRRISHELHDGTCQALMAVSLDLAVLDRRLRTEQLRSTVRDIRAQVLDVMHGVRQMSHLIHPPVLDDFGIIPAMESMSAKYRDATGLDVRVESPDAGTRFTPSIELLIFRAFQEGMGNIIKHADARTVRVRVCFDEGTLQLELEDDGRGFDAQAYFRSPPAAAGLGLIGMRERVAHYGGTFQIASRAGSGTVLDVRVPAEPIVREDRVATAV